MLKAAQGYPVWHPGRNQRRPRNNITPSHLYRENTMTQKHFNWIYAALFCVFLLTRYVIFPVTTIEFKKRLAFDSANGDVIIADGDSRSLIVPAQRSLVPVDRSTTYPFMKISINNTIYRCGCYFPPCNSKQFFNNYLANNNVITQIEILQINRRRSCLVLKMNYLGGHYNIYDDAKYARYLLNDSNLKKIEPGHNREYRLIIYHFIAFFYVMFIKINIENRRK